MSDHKKRKPNYSQNYNKKSNRNYMEIGHAGFLATCNFKEKDCTRECYNLLNQYLNETPITEASDGDVPKKEDEEEEIDISSQLEKEIADTKKTNVNRVFNAVSTDVANCVFIKTTIKNPVELGVKIIRDIAETKISKSKFILRFLPIESVCRANITDITNAAGILFDKYFLQPKSYSIIFNRRYNNSISREEIIKVLAELITLKNNKNKVDLKNGEVCVLVEVMKGLCCLSVLPDYFLLKKYNLAELGGTEEKTAEGETKVEEEPVAGGEEPASETEAKVKEEEEGIKAE